jgi:hypothetical protein
MRRLLFGIGVMVVFAVLVAGGLPASAAAREQPDWSLEPRHLVPGDQELWSVSCPTWTWCMAVGRTTLPDLSSEPLVRQWNGQSWRTIPTPALAEGGWFDAISCPTATTCAAVGLQQVGGRDQPLAEVWEVGRWRAQMLPPASGGVPEITDVSCVSASDCVGVGSLLGSTMAVEWNGSAWRAQRLDGEDLRSVSCSPDNACTAVGVSVSGGPRRAAQWVGSSSTWRQLPSAGSAPGSSASALSCISARWCMATWAADARATIWNGSSWTTEPLDRAGFLYPDGVACLTTNDCTVVGAAADLNWHVEHWDGRAWTPEPTPPGPLVDETTGPLVGASCVASHACVAVGGPDELLESDFQLQVTGLRFRRDGTLSFTAHTPLPGRIDVLETAWDDNLARAASVLQPATGRFVFARRAGEVSTGRTAQFRVTPGTLGVRLLRRHRYAVTVRLWVTFSAPGGRACSVSFYGLHPGSAGWRNTFRHCQG